ncbi:lactate dehydrogenase [Sporosarcina sp. P19]|uniref:ATP-grasp domain-containing protein n=1 Tax=Sporosarcina sp. P19 TaxID=2048258 RepID=UPI000C1673FE|nr:ATP-grasp domain-containing protein [Sporosarcina sp. P19]PIC77128.1 lactate dehydrogenase [Sporosarcina sp. P19]
MKKILIIGAGTLQIPAIIEAKKMGLKVATFDFDKNAPGFELADEAYVISTIDIDNALKKAKEINPDGVMTLASDMPLRTVAAIAKELDLCAVSEETAYAATNKAMMREQLKEYGVPIPLFYKVTTKSQFDKRVNQFRGKKFIVKPSDSSGSKGVYLCDDHTDMSHVYDYSMAYSNAGEILIEEYMIGQEVSVETFAVNGQINVITITDKITTGPPFFVEMGHTQPSKLSVEVQEQIRDIAISANKALNIQSGPSHVEIIVTQEGPKVVELGARLGGDNITTHLVPLSTGVNLVRACIKESLKEEPDLRRSLNKSAAIHYLKCPIGQITSITGLEVVKKIDRVIELKLFRKIGDTVTEVQNSNERIGYFICIGDSIKDTTELSEYLMDEIVKINV